MQEEDYWRIEQACRDAWPAAREEQTQGWVFRISGGETRRTNSVNALPAAKSVQSVMGEAEAFYGRHDRPLLFRTLSFQPEFEAELIQAGFRNLDETVCTLTAPLEGGERPSAHEIDLTLVPNHKWIEDKLRLTPMSAPQEKAYRFMLHHLRVPTAFARVSNAGQSASVAYGAISRGLLIIESVVTVEALRGQRMADATVAALMDWGFAAGAEVACLQVVQKNAPARALYNRLGFSQELYRYNYWCSGK